MCVRVRTWMGVKMGKGSCADFDLPLQSTLRAEDAEADAEGPRLPMAANGLRACWPKTNGDEARQSTRSRRKRTGVYSRPLWRLMNLL